MSDGVLPRRDGMPIDVWAVSWLLAGSILLTIVGGGLYVLGVGTTARDVVQAAAWAAGFGTYFYGRGVLENQRHLGGDLEDHERRVTRAQRDKLLLYTALAGVATVALGGYLALG